MAKETNKQETIIPMEPVAFTNITEQNVRASKITPMRLIVEYVSILNDWNPWKNDGFNKVKNEIIRLAVCN
jgi:hypothetical protein